MHKLFVLSIILFLFISCSSDFDIIDEWQDNMIVYCVLNPADSLQFVRINRGFLGEGNAYDMAQIGDSIEYPGGLNVKLQRFTLNNSQSSYILSSTYQLRDTLVPKDSINVNGLTPVFSTAYHRVYYTNGKIYEGIVQSVQYGGYVPKYRYKLSIVKPNSNDTVWSTINMIGANNMIITKPNNSNTNVDISDYTRQYEMEWKSIPNANLYQVVVCFNYKEYYGAQSFDCKVFWAIPETTSQGTAGGEPLTCTFNNVLFYQYIGGHINPKFPDLTVSRREAGKLDFYFYAAGEDLYTYIQLSSPNSGLIDERPTYSNIHHGLGLFSCRSGKVVYNKALSVTSITQIINGEFTKHLKFQAAK